MEGHSTPPPTCWWQAEVISYYGIAWHCLFQEYFSTTETGDQLSTLQAQVDDVKVIMTENIEKVMQRGENLDDLMDKTTDLETHVSNGSQCCCKILYIPTMHYMTWPLTLPLPDVGIPRRLCDCTALQPFPYRVFSTWKEHNHCMTLNFSRYKIWHFFMWQLVSRYKF